MPITPAEEQDLAFAQKRPLVAYGLTPVLATAANSLGTLALLKSKNPALAAGMMPAMAGAYFMGKRVEEIEREGAGVAQAVPVNPAFAIGGAMVPLLAAGAYSAVKGGTPEQRIMNFLKHAPHAVTGAAIGRSVALAGAYKRLAKERLDGPQPDQVWDEYSKTASQKRAMFDYISELPLPGGKFPNSQMETDFQVEHPVIASFKPFHVGGAVLGGLVAKKTGLPVLGGIATGYAAGSIPEAVMRYQVLAKLRKQLDAE